jgi:type I restriction enzyme R subunit
MIPTFTESEVEAAALEYFESLGYEILHGPDITGANRERANSAQVLLEGRLSAALLSLNPTLPQSALDEALARVRQVPFGTGDLAGLNRDWHRLLVDGVPVEVLGPDGGVRGERVRLVDWDEPQENNWAAVNQFTILERPGANERRPDVIAFVNGLPLGLIELKNAADANATTKKAWQQLQTYKKDLPTLCSYNEIMVASDGLTARAGTRTADWERFAPWRTIDGASLAPATQAGLEVLTRGVFNPKYFLDLVRFFVTFEDDGASGNATLSKKMAAYHQFHAVNKAVACSVEAASTEGDKRAGVVWHTQGSGKSLTMLFFAGRIVARREMENPTLVVLTDRNDLDEQLFGTFARGSDILRQTPAQATSREHLRELLRVGSGGVVFSTIQKFGLSEKGARQESHSERRNIVVIADEAHRSQYDFIDGFARHLRDALPNASFIGFTGTPIEAGDRSTQAIFGEYIDVYDIQQAVEDEVTVPIYYEARLARLQLKEEERPKIDPDFEDATEGEEAEVKERLKSKWAHLEAMVGSPQRLQQLARDLVEHFETRQDAIEGKAMIVGMSRRICAELYQEIVKLRPEWHADADDAGVLKVVMTGSAMDEALLQPHIRNKARREALAKRFKDASSDLKLVIVRDMWLTGFDAPCLHTMYADKPMQRHGLMRAIACVNRVFKDKPGGLIVDYLGLADNLKRALSSYTQGDREQVGVPQEVAVEQVQRQWDIVKGMLHGLDYSAWKGTSAAARLALLPVAQDHVLGLDDGKKRFTNAVLKLSRAFVLAAPHEAAMALVDDIAFAQAVRAALLKMDADEGGAEGSGQSKADIEGAVRQIVSRSVVSDEILDIFSAAGLRRPNIGILSDEFLEEVREMPQRNLAVEVLRKLLGDQIREKKGRNVVEARSFAALLEAGILKYQNRSIEAAAVVEELVDLARQMREAAGRGEKLGLNDDEVAFYDALEVSDNAVQVLGDGSLKAIARELVSLVRSNATLDWTQKDAVRAHLRRLVKRVLRKHGYPPEKQDEATQTVIEQAEQSCRTWAKAA